MEHRGQRGWSLRLFFVVSIVSSQILQWFPKRSVVKQRSVHVLNFGSGFEIPRWFPRLFVSVVPDRSVFHLLGETLKRRIPQRPTDRFTGNQWWMVTNSVTNCFLITDTFGLPISFLKISHFWWIRPVYKYCIGSHCSQETTNYKPLGLRTFRLGSDLVSGKGHRPVKADGDSVI